MSRIIDLRSDTVTKPTPAMRQAIADADVGDDVYGEDPTVNRLEERAAGILGKEAAIFVPTGTMGNTIAIKLHTQHGQEVICDSRAHILDWELSMTAWFAGCLVRAIPTVDGLLHWDDIQRNLRAGGVHSAATGLIEIENTHNMGGGKIYPLETLREIYTQAQHAGIKVHMDGARIFNASVASGVPVSEIASQADSVMFCLSKALGAPVGSMLVGTKAAIHTARQLRKRLGGGMRQAGVLAAAGLIALEQGPARLAADHQNALHLAAGLSQIGNVTAAPPQTNIVMIDISRSGISAPEISRRLKPAVLMNAINPTTLRAVTHYDVARADCDRAIEILGSVITRPAARATII